MLWCLQSISRFKDYKTKFLNSVWTPYLSEKNGGYDVPRFDFRQLRKDIINNLYKDTIEFKYILKGEHEAILKKDILA